MKKVLTLSLLLSWNYSSYSQVKVMRNALIGKNLALMEAVNKIPAINLSIPIDTIALAKQDILDVKNGLPYRFGVPFNTDIGLSSGKWKDTVDGRIWTLQISSANAHSLNFQLDQFFLGKGSELMLYNGQGTMQMGPFTSKQNNAQGVLATDLMEGSSVTFHLFEPDSVKGSTKLHIFKIVHGDKNSFGNNNGPAGYGQSASCEVNIACAAGANWQAESNAVAMVINSSGYRVCSAALLNDVCKDFRPFVLTAFHCVDIDDDGTISTAEANSVTYLVFRFKYKSPACSGGDGTNYLTYSGATLRAASHSSDFALVEMLNTPSAADNVAYAGWSRSTTPLTSGAMIHHPMGDVMKISTVSSTATLYTYPGYPTNTHWAVVFSSGTNEYGSSGAPLFDQNHHIVGQDHGNQLNQCVVGAATNCFCSYPQGQFGRFDLSWTGGGTSSTRLMDWLDPNGTNTMSLNTETIPVITQTNSTCTSATYQINTADPVTWSVSSGFSISGSNTSPSVAVNGVGNVSLTATLSTCSSITAYFTIGAQPINVTSTVDRTPQPSHYQYLTATVTQLPGATYSWYQDVGGTPTTLLGTGVQLTHYPLPPCTTLYFDCVANETCLPAVIYHGYAYNTYCSGGNAISNDFVAFPNPASTILMVTKNTVIADDATVNQTGEQQTTTQQTIASSFKIVLYDNKGNILRSGQTSNASKSVQVNIEGISNGTYYLHIIQGEKVIEKQIIIKH